MAGAAGVPARLGGGGLGCLLPSSVSRGGGLRGRGQEGIKAGGVWARREAGLGPGERPQVLGGSAGGSHSRFPPLCPGLRPKFVLEEAKDWLFGC